MAGYRRETAGVAPTAAVGVVRPYYRGPLLLAVRWLMRPVLFSCLLHCDLPSVR